MKITAFGFLQSKEEVMAVRLREADNIAAMAELQQQISELEIQVNLIFLTDVPVESLRRFLNFLTFLTFKVLSETVNDVSPYLHGCAGFSLSSSLV